MYVHLCMGNGSANRRIWKYSLEVIDAQVVEMPAGANLLAVDEQHPGTLQLWAVVNPGAPRVARRILIRGTGHSLDLDPEEGEPHIGTVLAGALVWHVFDGGVA